MASFSPVNPQEPTPASLRRQDTRQPPQRTLKVPSTEHSRKHFCSNEVVTAKYTYWTWAPKSLLWQFRRAANIYFLVISVLSTQSFSAKRWDSMVGTFGLVLVLTMIKEAWEDYFRHKQDNIVNRAPTSVLDWTKCEFDSIQARNLKVGDIVKVRENEAFPADLLLIASADDKGIAFVDTMNLDGETNLKDRSAVAKTRAMRSTEELVGLDLSLEYDPPRATLVDWNCNYSFKSSALDPLSPHNLLLRGCILRNTTYVLGLVLYTGKDTKISLNSKSTPSKLSSVLLRMNKLLYTVFAFQAVICFLFAGLSLYWTEKNASKHDRYLEVGGVKGETFVISVLTFLVAYSHLIPISLYVAMEILKLAQAFLISRDLDMYYEADDKRANCRSSDLIEELGMVQFIFSDKTGTLTQNVMEFKECSIQGQVYAKNPSTGRFAPVFDQKEATESEKETEFYRFLSLCHSVFASDSGPGSTLKYQAASPDELALVSASALMGFTYTGKLDNIVTVRTASGEECWEVLTEIPFNSARKRMSVFVRESRGGEIKLLCKGADNVLLPLITKGDDTEVVKTHLNGFAVKGLRTLVLAERTVKLDEYRSWADQWHEISLSSSPDKQSRLDSHASLLETDLSLIGATAIEDKLQDGVPETIATLLSAEIRVWVLTGDKQETAIEIGKSCNLLPTQDRLIVLSSDTRDALSDAVHATHAAYFPEGTPYILDSVRNDLKLAGKGICLVIDGVSLEWVMDPKLGVMRKFYELGVVSSSCVCCRVSPAQKMKVVQMVKEEGKWISLAIGDGANDVSMIQEANIGVGISGKEGTQAVQAADYSLSQFRFLTKLLLVHGRWGYRRISTFICYYFYKNMVIVFAEICFAFFNGFSGQLYWADWIPALYNTFWTSWPCLLTFAYEQDLNKENSIKFPIAYKAGQIGRYFTLGRFWMWIACAIFHGMVCFWVPMIGLDFISGDDGKATGLFWISTLSFTILMHVVSYKLLLDLIVYYICIILMSLDPIAKTFQANMNQLFFKLLDTPTAWIVILFVPWIALLPDIGVKVWRSVYRPDPVTLLMRRQKGRHVELEEKVA